MSVVNVTRPSAASRASSVELAGAHARSSDVVKRLQPGLGGAGVDLAHDDVEPGPGAHLGDARSHQAAADHAHPLEVRRLGFVGHRPSA